MLLICQDYLLFKHYFADFENALADYSDQVDLYYAADQS